MVLIVRIEKSSIVDVLLLMGLTLSVYSVVLLEGKIILNIDVITHYRWNSQFAEALAGGTWYPLWMARARLGLGELSYSAYPLYHYVNAALVSCGLDVWTASKTMAVLATLAGGLVVYFRLKPVVGRISSLFAACFWVLAPFPFFLFTHHGALPWQFSLPFALELLFCCLLPSTRISLPRASLVIAFLAFAHVLVAFMVLICIGLTIALRALINTTANISQLLRWFASALIGVGVTAFHYLPARASHDLISLHRETPGWLLHLNWRNSFLFPLYSAYEWGVRWFSVQWIYPSLSLAGVVVCGVALSRYKEQLSAKREIALTFALFASFGLVLGSELAIPLYFLETPFRSLQWPYRFNTVATLGIATSLPVITYYCVEKARLTHWTSMLAIVVTSAHLFVLGGLQWQLLMQGEDPSLDETRLIGEFGQYGAELKTIGPSWREYVQQGGLPKKCALISATCSEKVSSTQHRIWKLRLVQPGELVFPLFAFPGWEVLVNGRPTTFRIDPGTGLIALDLAQGSHEVEILMAGLPQRRAGILISLLSISALVLIAVSSRQGRMRKRAVTPLGVERPPSGRTMGRAND